MEKMEIFDVIPLSLGWGEGSYPGAFQARGNKFIADKEVTRVLQTSVDGRLIITIFYKASNCEGVSM